MENYKNKIILGDVLTVLKSLPDNLIDLGITSPPYNKQQKGGPIVKSVVYDEFDDILPEDVYQSQQIEILNELWRITKPGGSFFYNHRCRWEEGNMIHPIEWLDKCSWNVKQEIIWNRSITGNLRGWRFWQIDERVYWLYKPDDNKIGKELKSKHARMSSIWNIMPENNNPHPAPFPLDLPTRIIYSLFDDDKEKLVMDPYMGSGTVGVACKLFGCNYLGIDISKTYIDMANERINNYENFRERYNKEIEKHIITGITYQERKAKKKEKEEQIINMSGETSQEVTIKVKRKRKKITKIVQGKLF
jgi:site-specific DNA-methyltransferase (adenine-specific)